MTALAIDATGDTLWIGTANGAIRIDLTTLESARFEAGSSGLASDAVAAVAVGTNGAVYFGYGKASCQTGFCGLTRFDPASESWTTFTEANSNLIDDRVYAIAIAPDGMVWAGTNNGAVYTRTDSWTPYFDYHDCNHPGTHCEPVWSYTLSDIAFEPDGTAWFAIEQMIHGTQPKPGGVARRSPEGLTDTWSMADGLPSNRVEDITLIDGIPWASSRDGVVELDDQSGSWEVRGQWDVLDVAAFQSSIWVVTATGAHRYETTTGQWESFEDQDCTLSQPIEVMLAFDRTICFGMEGGVGCYRTDSASWFYPYTYEHGE